MKNSIAIVLARGGSKGIPKKNLIQICGKPLIYYCLNALFLSQITEYYVSTDSIEIADTSSQYGAKIINRPKELSTDTSSSLEALLHSVYTIQNKAENILLIQPTSPLILSQDINNIISIMSKYDSALTLTESHNFYWELHNGQLREKNHKFYERKPRQLLPKTFTETGSIYATKYDRLIKTSQILSGNIGYVNIPKYRSFQIDEYNDIPVIESMIRNSSFNMCQIK